jgi:uncharacterized protein with ParB-like and HNH nuclease domain
MQYRIESWSIERLIQLVKSSNILLTPPFQRNYIWTTNDQTELIDTIINNNPLPTFFLFENSKDKYEMIDGQQRTRTILKFWEGHFKTSEGKFFTTDNFPGFKNYKLPFVIITKLSSSDSLENFYARVNRLGKRLNRPELNKAEYLHTNFLKLVEELTQLDEFIKLKLFQKSTINRMNDRDFVEEIVTIFKFGITDKKLSVDKLFESDIDDKEYANLKKQFIGIINKINKLNNIYLINNTRYKQKNDFYTLCTFIFFNSSLSQEDLNYFYHILVLISNEISPSNEFSDYLREYAINCVSQSNSKDAREKRLHIWTKLLLNIDSSPNEVQLDLINYYSSQKKIDISQLDKISKYHTLNWKTLNNIYKMSFNENVI